MGHSLTINLYLTDYRCITYRHIFRQCTVGLLNNDNKYCTAWSAEALENEIRVSIVRMIDSF